MASRKLNRGKLPGTVPTVTQLSVSILSPDQRASLYDQIASMAGEEVEVMAPLYWMECELDGQTVLVTFDRADDWSDFTIESFIYRTEK